MNTTTVGISPKAIAALAWPLVLAATATACSWIVSGDFNDAETKTALAGVITSIVSYVGAYVAPAGEVR